MSLTPVGDYLRKRYPPNDGATHSLGAGDDPGCCAGPHPNCTYDSGWREGLRSVAADMREMAAAVHPNCTYDSGWREGLRSVAADMREMAAAVLPNIGTLGAMEALARTNPNAPGQIQGRLLLDLADMAERKAGRSPS